MSDRNSNDTIILDEVLLLLSVVSTLSRTLNTEVDEDMEIPRKPRSNGTQTTTSVRTPATTFSMEFMRTKTWTISVEMAQMMVPLIIEQFTMIAEVTKELMVQLRILFPHRYSQQRLFVLYDKLCGLAAATNNYYSQVKDEFHLHSRHSPTIKDSKLYCNPRRRKAVCILRNRISRTNYVVCKVQQDINGKYEQV